MASGRGGARSGAGRKPGGKNRLTQSVKATLTELAQGYTEEAVSVLVQIMRDVEANPAARITAANSVLDRGHGKPVAAGEDGITAQQPINVVILRD